MENCIASFRDNIFDPSKRKTISEEFVVILKRDLPKQTMSKFSKEQLEDLAERVFQSLTVVMEFMDKGIKGLLTGDLSIYMLQSIETILEKHLNKLIMVSTEFEGLLEKRKEAAKLYSLMQEFDSPYNNLSLKESLEDSSLQNVYLPDIGIDLPVKGKDAHRFKTKGLKESQENSR